MSIIKNVYQGLKQFHTKVFGNKRVYSDDLKYFKPEDCILDIPCGTGFFLENPHTIVGVDLNFVNLSVARQRGTLILQADGLKLPFQSDTFDGIHCAHLIEHLFPSECVALFSELTRILKLGGIVVMRTPMMHKFFYNELTHIRPYPPSAITTLLNISKGGDPTLQNKELTYQFVDLTFWHRDFFQLSYEVGFNPKRYKLAALLKGLGKFLGSIGIKHPEINEYRLVVCKTANTH